MPEWVKDTIMPGAILFGFGLLWKFVGPHGLGAAVSKMINSKIGHKAGELLQEKLNKWIDEFQMGMDSDNKK
jgi:hypothetical protein